MKRVSPLIQCSMVKHTRESGGTPQLVKDANVLRAHSHLPQLSTDSAVDCVNAEMENFLSLCRNATDHCGILISMNEPLGETKHLWTLRPPQLRRFVCTLNLNFPAAPGSNPMLFHNYNFSLIFENKYQLKIKGSGRVKKSCSFEFKLVRTLPIFRRGRLLLLL